MKPGEVPKRIDYILLLVLVILSLLPVFKYSFLEPPSEDAAMLLRYSKHLAEGHGIVWNVGEAPLDGATDFLFMVLLAMLAKMGLGLERGAQLVGIVSHTLTVSIVYLFIRYRWSARWAAFIPAAYLAIGPGMGYAAAGFGTPFFALLACTTWCLANILVERDSLGATPFLLAASGLIMGLIRPEGVFLAIFMLAAVIYMKGLSKSKAIIAYFLGVFVILGGTYFFWRWHYFGHPLPNPYYKKGGFHLHLPSLAVAISNTIILALPFVPMFLTGFRTSRSTRQAVFALIPILSFTIMWLFMSNEMNYLMRFQYPVLPIALISWPPVIRYIREDWNLPGLSDFDTRRRATLVALAAGIGLGFVFVQQKASIDTSSPHEGLYNLSTSLRSYSGRGYTIACTEAGLLPFYSDWKAVDAWGLNDAWIAHNHRITEAYLDTYKPEVIMFHAYFSPLVKPRPKRGFTYVREWFDMVMTLKTYAEKRGYILAASYGETPDEAHYYYVRPGFPDSEKIVKLIRDTRYVGGDRTEKDYDFASIKAAMLAQENAKRASRKKWQ